MRFFIFLLILFACRVFAGDKPLSAHPRVNEALGLLEVWADAQRAYEEIPGLSMAVVYDQELLWQNGFGYVDLEKTHPVTAQTKFSICSISKLFTSIAVMQLRDTGKLRLDDPVANLLPWYDIEDTYPDAPPVTVEGLLTHSSGLPRESAYPYWTNPDFPFPTEAQVRERLSDQKELYPAATYFQYSNLGMTLAGEIVTRLSGMPYADYISQQILVPLQMQNTTPEIPLEEHGDEMAVGHTALTREGCREVVPVFQAKGIAPAAGFASTVEDMARFAMWQIRVLDDRETAVLSRNTLREMQRIHWTDPDGETTWGLGFDIWRTDDKIYVGHGGNCPGYRSMFSLQPDSKIAAVVMANANGIRIGKFTSNAQKILAPAIAAALDPKDDAKPTNPDFEIYTGRYDERPWGGETAVIFWKEGLALVELPTDDPLKNLIPIKNTGSHVFRRIRSDNVLGEEIVFEIGDDGQVTGLWRHENFSPRVR